MKILKRNVSKDELKEFLNNIDLEDKNLYEELGENQNWIFQFSGNTGSRMTAELKPDNFDDVINLNAMSRPGSSYNFGNYCLIKNENQKSPYPEQIQKFLSKSRGLINFQEEIMQITEYISNGKISGNACFEGNSLVETENGKKKIKDLNIGERVWSFNEKTKEKELKEVVNFFDNGIKNTIRITLENDKIIECTPEHLFLTKNRGWVKALELKGDDDILELEK